MRERATRVGGSRVDVAALAGLLLILIAWYLEPFIAHRYPFPIGPDAPVYLWWTRLAGHDGLSAVARPGVPTLALVMEGTLHVSLSAAMAALECALGVGLGLAAAALARTMRVRREVDLWEERVTWLLVGTLTGTFAVHLAAGYLANLALAELFVAMASALAMARRRATVAAALLLGAAGLADPPFLLVGLVILMIAATMAWGRIGRNWLASPERPPEGSSSSARAGWPCSRGPLPSPSSRPGMAS